METLNLVQGSPEWLAHRAKHLNASDAPVMMGASKHMKRNELLRMMATGDEKEVHEWVQKNLYDKGHEYEAAARTLAEEMIGEELFPATGVEGKLSASFDGLTMDEETIFEHKMWNTDLAESVRANDIGPEYYWQLEQELLISKAKRVIFVVSDGTREHFVCMEYRPVAGRAEYLKAAWAQFEQDLEGYAPAPQKVEVVGRDMATLPPLSVQIVGEVKSSNLIVYKQSALAVIRAINTDLQTDQHFADAEKTVKFCDRTEKELELVKQQALSQTSTIDELFRTVDELIGEMRNKRLELEKLVKARKEAIRVEIKQRGEDALRQHIAAINKRLGKVTLPPIAADFSGVMRGKKTVSSLQDAVDTELAHRKIESSAIAETIETNLSTLGTVGGAHGFLFSDIQQLVLKDSESLLAIIKGRIAEHDEKERARIEAERDRIRQEEERKAQQDAERKAESERARIRQEEADKLRREQEQAKAQEPPARPAPIASGKGKKAAAIAAASLPPALPGRPTDSQILFVVAHAFRVDQDVAVQWLRTMDLDAVQAA